MATIYKWNKYKINIPSSTSFAQVEGDFPLAQLHDPRNDIAAIAFNDFSALQVVIGEISGLKTMTYWKLDTSQLKSRRVFSTNDGCFSADYNYVFLPEFSIEDGLIGWQIGYATTGAWNTHNRANEVFHIITGSQSHYTDYNIGYCPNISECNKGDFIEQVTSPSQGKYPTNGIAYVENFKDAYWYEYIGSEETTKYTVSVIASPSDGGTVSGGGSFSSGASTTITATPNTGYTFSGWYESGTLVSNNSLFTTNVTRNRTFIAQFSPKNYTISVSAQPTAGGSVSGGGTYANGNSVTVIASPNNNYTFSHWKEGSTQVSTSASYTFTASGDRTLVAVFTATKIYYTVTLTASPSEGGVISGGGSYENGSSVTVIAVANSGYNFNGWYEGSELKSSSTAYTFTIEKDTVLQAQFAEEIEPEDGTESGVFIGVDNIAQKVSKIYFGVGGKARKVVKGYIGIDGKARLFYLHSDWKVATLPSSALWRSIAYGDGKFVALAGQNGRCAYSVDGVNWTATDLPVSANFTGITYSGSKFVSLSNEENIGVIYSTDGITWTYKALSLSGVSYCNDVAYGYGYVAVVSGESKALVSSNGTSWSTATLPTSDYWISITYGGGKFVVVGNTGRASAYSTNRTTWTGSNLPSYSTWMSVTYGGDKFVAIGRGGAVAYSKNATSWTAATLPSSSVEWQSITYGGGKFVAVGNGDIIAYSDDGISWKTKILPFFAQCDNVVYGDGKFVVPVYNSNKVLYISVEDF